PPPRPTLFPYTTLFRSTFDYTLWGIDNFLIRSNGYGFTSFLPSFVNETTGAREPLTDRTSVWLSLRYNHTLAIVDRTASGPNELDRKSTRLNSSHVSIS